MMPNGNKKKSSIFAYDEEKKNDKTLTFFLKIFVTMFCVFALIEGCIIISDQVKGTFNISDKNVSKNNYVFIDVEEIYGPVSAKVSITKFQGYYVLAKDKTSNNYYVLFFRNSICDKYLRIEEGGKTQLLVSHIDGSADDLPDNIFNEIMEFSGGEFKEKSIGRVMVNVNDRGVLYEGISYILVSIIFAIFIIPRKKKSH